MKNFFLSLKTTVWTLFALICLFFIGAYVMPVYRDTFATMNDDILLNWVKSTAASDLSLTWWFFAAVAGLVLLTINTIVCSFQAIKGKWKREDFLLRISPQIVHTGFLCILLAHLLGAVQGYKISGLMPERAAAPLPENRSLYLQEIRAQTDASGYIRDWAARVFLYENNQPVKSGVLGPNQPLFYKGTGVYLKSLSFESGPAAVLLVTKDPGAGWALAGSVLFMLGTLTLLILKLRKA
jgi:cytochrome c biogenesis protein ResB